MGKDLKECLEEGQLKHAAGQFEDAIACYKEAYKLPRLNGTNRAVILSNMVDSYIALSKYKDALLCIRDAFETNKDYLPLSCEEFDEKIASKFYLLIRKIENPENADVKSSLKWLIELVEKMMADYFCNVGITCVASQWYEEAILYLTKALDLNQDLAVAHYNRGLSYAALNRRTEAVKDYKITQKLAPHDTPFITNAFSQAAQQQHLSAASAAAAAAAAPETYSPYPADHAHHHHHHALDIAPSTQYPASGGGDGNVAGSAPDDENVAGPAP